jgi:hypothetical protein
MHPALNLGFGCAVTFFPPPVVCVYVRVQARAPSADKESKDLKTARLSVAQLSTASMGKVRACPVSPHRRSAWPVAVHQGKRCAAWPLTWRPLMMMCRVAQRHLSLTNPPPQFDRGMKHEPKKKKLPGEKQALLPTEKVRVSRDPATVSSVAPAPPPPLPPS